ncbi:FmdB family zinc ribbon protein [Fluviispira multicolorata]|uniref:Uncharacterized protein n=1 Tax=Fluviispira multicolorata TaxID=2654512 RepID=A0A833JF02_9BACT|nr:hypothetical protein [Fluviispira multicolorata]KAB8033479.1 hypothetical protein GCL57_01895 [Fluviispira multicolorata]
MPIYIYEPTIWSENEPVNNCCFFEKLQSVNQESIKKCPTCGHDVHRAVTAFNVNSQAASASSTALANNYFAFNKAKGDSPAAKAARLAMRHVCGMGCKH